MTVQSGASSEVADDGSSSCVAAAEAVRSEVTAQKSIQSHSRSVTHSLTHSLTHLFQLTPDLGALVERGDLSMDQAMALMVCQSVGQSDCSLKERYSVTDTDVDTDNNMH